MRALGALCAAIGALTLLSCGGVKPGDLFILTRTGSTPQARLTMLLNEEGGVRCNGGSTLKVSDPQLVQARAIQEDLHDLASSHLALAARPGSVFSYSLRDPDGSVRFADNSLKQPRVLRNLQLFVLQVSQQVCHIS